MVIIIDSLIIGGVRFVLDKVVQAVDRELSDDTVLREELLATQMRRELGEITEEEFAEKEADLLARIRDIRQRNKAPTPAPGEMRIAGVEATFTGDEHEPEEDPGEAGHGRKR
jgi:gas vesicle protein GvpG